MRNEMRTMIALLCGMMLFGSAAWAADEHSVADVPVGGNQGGMSRFYTGTLSETGTFKGKLVCLRCDLAHGPGTAAECKKEGHRHALSMDGGSMVHPLLAGSEDAQAKINSDELHGKEVAVHGQHYPSTGTIFADRVDPAP